MLAREAILKAPQRFNPLEAFGGNYSIRVLTAREYDKLVALTRACHESRNFDGYREKVVAMLLGDANGLRVFKDEEFETLRELDVNEMEKIATEGMKLNRLLPESFNEAKKA